MVPGSIRGKKAIKEDKVIEVMLRLVKRRKALCWILRLSLALD